MNVQYDAGRTINYCCHLDHPEGVLCPICVVAAGCVAVEASSIDSMYVTGILEISGNPQESPPDRHLELLLPDTHVVKSGSLPVLRFIFPTIPVIS